MSSASVDANNNPDKRERWSSRIAFYMAAVGSAVGYGNVWRFPSLVFEYGGGAFFIPYLCALFFIGLPILVLEIALGQYYESGDVGVFGSIHARLRGVGMCSIACGYMLVTYYSALLAWTCNAFFASFAEDNIWAQEKVTGLVAKNYFYDEIIGQSTLGDDQRPTRLMWKNVGYSFLTWVVVFFCVAFGIKWTGRITYFTMGLPVIMLFVFLGRAVTLEGAQDGIDVYIRNSNWDIFTEQPSIWSAAVAQIFFSLGITFGIMTAYGSFCKPNEPAFFNSCVIATSNSLFSFIAGFAVFATLGHLAMLEGKEVSELEYSGFGLVFGSWPVALGTLPGGEHWIRLLFIMLFLLGIDSAFSFMEAFLAVAQDTAILANVNRKVLSFGLTFSAFLFSLMYCTDAGLNFLDTIDYYINFVMLFVGGVECFAAGWVYKIEDQIESLGANIVIAYIVTTFGSVTLACILWFGLSNADAALWAGFVGLIVSYAIGMAFIFFLMRKKKEEDPEKTWGGMYYDLTMRNVMHLRSDLSQSVGRVPVVWAFLVKHFIPPIILVLFALFADADTKKGKKKFGHYGDYPTHPYQVLGILTVVFVCVLFFSSMVFPNIYAGLQKQDSKEDITFKAAPVLDAAEDVAAEPVDGANETSAKDGDEDEVAVEAAAKEVAA